MIPRILLLLLAVSHPHRMLAADWVPPGWALLPTGLNYSFTAAFLWAYLRGGSLQACCACGCAVGTAVVQVLGAELTASRWGELRGDLETVLRRDREARG